MRHLTHADRGLTTIARFMAKWAGFAGVTPYQVGMLLALIPLLPIFLTPAYWLSLAGMCKVHACQGHIGQTTGDMTTLMLMWSSLAIAIAACIVSFRLCMRRQREWESSLRTGGLSTSPSLFMNTVLGQKIPLQMFAIICCVEIFIEFASLFMPYTGISASMQTLPHVDEAIVRAFDLFSYCIICAVHSAIAHALFNDYLLKEMPRIQPRRRHAFLGFPAFAR